MTKIMWNCNDEQAVVIHKLKNLIEDAPHGKILAVSGVAGLGLTIINLHKAL